MALGKTVGHPDKNNTKYNAYLLEEVFIFIKLVQHREEFLPLLSDQCNAIRVCFM